MSRPLYPLTGYQEVSVAPSSNVIVRRAQNGRIITNEVGEFSDTTVEISHPFISLSEANDIYNFWAETKQTDFEFNDQLRGVWVCSWLGEPLIIHERGAYFTVNCRFVRRSMEQNN